MYFQYFTFKALDVVISLNLLQIFFQRNIFRKLRIIVITSSHWIVVSIFWVIWGNVRCRLMKPLTFWGLHKNNYAFHFIFFKNVSVSFVVFLTINRDITFHEKATVHIWFIAVFGVIALFWISRHIICPESKLDFEL